ncbi:hypothetical protein [Ottowia sp. VDI28]|uniref:hypothetical protein n=1 Tax=Ottowia sp. VDI28 TaxID=3133968 RepID=UPI003C2C21CF
MEADIAAATHIRLPTRFAYQNRNGVVDASCIAQASKVHDATITSYRTRGPNFKRLKATTTDGVTYVVDLVSNSFDFTDLAPTGVIRGTGSAVVEGVLEVENARFSEIEARIEEGNRLKTEAHASWRNGINYVSELEAVEGQPTIRRANTSMTKATYIVLLRTVALEGPPRVHGVALDAIVPWRGMHLLIALSLVFALEDLLAESLPGGAVEWPELGGKHQTFPESPTMWGDAHPVR